VQSKDSNLIIEVVNSEAENEFLLGKLKFPLKRITNQDEYDAYLEIPDEHDEQLIIIKVKAKIRFIWSYLKLFQEMQIKTEKTIASYEKILAKSNQLIDSLNEPFKFNTPQNQNPNYNSTNSIY